jgi:hypothetical protein
MYMLLRCDTMSMGNLLPVISKFSNREAQLLVRALSHPVLKRQTECEPCTCQDQLFTYTAVT